MPWEAPPNPDPDKILDEAQTDTAAGRYAQALEKHVWFHENALKFKESLAGVRLSYALADWMKLASLYPAALEMLKQIRDDLEKNVREATEPRRAFLDFRALNDSLDEPAKTRDLFVWLHTNQPSAAKSVYDVAQPALVQTEEYRLCGAYLEPEASFQGVVQMFRHMKGLAEGSAFAELQRLNPEVALPMFDSLMKQEILQSSRNQFCRDAGTQGCVTSK